MNYFKELNNNLLLYNVSKSIGCNFEMTSSVSVTITLKINGEKRMRECTFLLSMIPRKFVLCSLNMRRGIFQIFHIHITGV